MLRCDEWNHRPLRSAAVRGMAGHVIWLSIAGVDWETLHAMTKATTHRRTRYAVCFLAAALVLGGIVEAGPAVLCVAGDGHTDVEYGLAGCCVLAVDNREQTVSQSVLSGGQGCDGCADLDLGKSSLRSGLNNLPAPGVNVIRLPVTQSIFCSADTSEIDPHIGIAAQIAALSSVILLT